MVTPINIRALTQTKQRLYQDGRPCFDPTGTIVLFERGGNGLTYTQLWTVPIDDPGTEQEYYSNPTHDCLRAAWSWDSNKKTQRIAFTGKNFPVYLIDANPPHFNERKLIVQGYENAHLSYPAWYPNSTDLLIANYSEKQLIKADVNGCFLGELSDVAYYSGMGTMNHAQTDMIAYAGQVIPPDKKYKQSINQVWVQDGSNAPQLFSPSGNDQIGRVPWFTSDGSYMGYENHDDNHVMQIWMKAVKEPYGDQTPSQISTAASQHVKFSPDGKTAVWAQGQKIYAADLVYS